MSDACSVSVSTHARYFKLFKHSAYHWDVIRGCQDYFMGSLAIAIVHHSHYRRYVPRLDVLFSTGIASRQELPHSCQGLVCHLYHRGYNSRLQALGVLQVTSELSTLACDTVLKHPFTSPYVSPKAGQVTTLYTLWNTLSVMSPRYLSVHNLHSSALAYSTKFRGRNFKHFKTSVGRAR